MTEPPHLIRPIGRPGDLGWVVQAHGETYAAEFGWDASFEALVAQIVADFAAAGESGADDGPRAGWIAELDGRRAGCVLCVPAGDRVAQLRILLVDPAARGHGIGAALVDACTAFARQAGYERMRLWTNEVLAAARRIYLSRGFALTQSQPHHSFGADLVGQVYELDLRATAVSGPGFPGQGRAEAVG